MRGKTRSSSTNSKPRFRYQGIKSRPDGMNLRSGSQLVGFNGFTSASIDRSYLSAICLMRSIRAWPEPGTSETSISSDIPSGFSPPPKVISASPPLMELWRRIDLKGCRLNSSKDTKSWLVSASHSVSAARSLSLRVSSGEVGNAPSPSTRSRTARSRTEWPCLVAASVQNAHHGIVPCVFRLTEESYRELLSRMIRCTGRNSQTIWLW